MQSLSSAELVNLKSPSPTTSHPSPFIKWAGGKRHLLRYLLPVIPLDISNYYEPFLGGGALFFALCSQNMRFRGFLSDLNPELINTYNVVRTAPEELIRHLAKLQERFNNIAHRNELYYVVRKSKPDSMVESAARFIFLNKTCYNGLYRVNKQGGFNVPFGRQNNARIFDASNIQIVSKALRDANAHPKALDYRKATENCAKDDLVYLDPPYHPGSDTSNFTDYTTAGFSEENQEELARLFRELVDRSCFVLLTNSDTPRIRKLYSPYYKQSIPVSRPISCIGSKRKGFKEMIVLGRRKSSGYSNLLEFR